MVSDSDSETDEGFERMDVDRRQETPEDETESEDEDVELDGPAPSNRPGLVTPSSPPPRRELPFTRETKRPADGESHPPLEDPGESDDDEL